MVTTMKSGSHIFRLRLFLRSRRVSNTKVGLVFQGCLFRNAQDEMLEACPETFVCGYIPTSLSFFVRWMGDFVDGNPDESICSFFNVYADVLQTHTGTF